MKADGGVLHNNKHPRMEDDNISAGVITESINLANQNSSEQNPMMNAVILKHLFELTSSRIPQDLNTCRAVSSRWYNATLPVWLKNGPAVTIKTDFNQKHQNGKKGFNDRFLQFLEEAHLSPSTDHEDIVGMRQYRKFLLENGGGDRTYSRLHFQVFWKECGAHLTHLTLKYFKIPDSLTFRDILFSKFTPNLEQLVVEVDSVEGPPVVVSCLLNYNTPPEQPNLNTLKVEFGMANGNDFPLEWKALLHTFPNLKNLGIGSNLSESESQVKEILTAIQEIRAEDNGRLDLKSLIWYFNVCFCCNSYELSPAPLPSSSSSPLSLDDEPVEPNLETLKVALRNGESKELVNKLLSSYGKSLKRVELFKCGSFSCFCGFPHMPQLTFLEIRGHPVENLSFLRELPALRSLALLTQQDHAAAAAAADWPFVISDTLILTLAAVTQQSDMSGMMIITFPSITEFRCDYRIDWTADDVDGLQILMPNLSRLEMRLNNANLPVVCQTLSQHLEHLYIHGDGVGDDGVIGVVPAKKGIQISSIMHPNISRLQNLKTFEMDWAPDLTSNFTKDSVIHGLAKIPQLEKLVIHMHDTYAPAHPELQQVIREKIPFVEILVHNSCVKCHKEFDFSDSDLEEEEAEEEEAAEQEEEVEEEEEEDAGQENENIVLEVVEID